MKVENGERLPEVEARSLDGDRVQLPGELEGGWSILLFYRGHW